jgi:hypothetical protein
MNHNMLHINANLILVLILSRYLEKTEEEYNGKISGFSFIATS